MIGRYISVKYMSNRKKIVKILAHGYRIVNEQLHKYATVKPNVTLLYFKNQLGMLKGHWQ
jgi:hypothetical protein